MLLKNKKKISGNSFNFGPYRSDNKRVSDILKILKKDWKELKLILTKKKSFKEHNLLQLSSEQAYKILKWRSILTFKETIRLTSEWYSALKNKENMKAFSHKQIRYYEAKFKKKVDF